MSARRTAGRPGKSRFEPFTVNQQIAAVLYLNELLGETAPTDTHDLVPRWTYSPQGLQSMRAHWNGISSPLRNILIALSELRPTAASATEHGVADVPVLMVQMPAGPDESRFFGATLLVGLGPLIAGLGP